MQFPSNEISNPSTPNNLVHKIPRHTLSVVTHCTCRVCPPRNPPSARLDARNVCVVVPGCTKVYFRNALILFWLRETHIWSYFMSTHILCRYLKIIKTFLYTFFSETFHILTPTPLMLVVSVWSRSMSWEGSTLVTKVRRAICFVAAWEFHSESISIEWAVNSSTHFSTLETEVCDFKSRDLYWSLSVVNVL